MDKNELTYGKCGGCGEGIKPGTVHVYDMSNRKCAIYNRGEVIGASEPHQQYVPTVVEAQPELPGVESTLAERAKRYGDFAMAAKATQDIKAILFGTGWNTTIPADCRQAAEMIVTKLVRAMYGEPEFPDNWHDIAGYATLVERRLRG